MLRKIPILLFIMMLLSCSLFSQASDSARSTADDLGITALIRCDDAGMCHAVNEAIKQIADSGIPSSVSVMVPCPWFQEAVAILKSHPHVSPGIHLTLNSEWRDYRWGPVAGASAVPSLVDSMGYFFHTRAAFFEHKPKLEEVELELRAQIDRARRSGLRFEYLDYHMSTAVTTPELRALVEKLAHEYGLAISRYFGEQDVEGVYRAPIESKRDTLVERVRNLAPGPIRLFVFHTGFQTPEMDALVDVNAIGPPEVGKQRDAERRALLSPEFRAALVERQVKLLTYRDLVKQVGLAGMRRPE